MEFQQLFSHAHYIPLGPFFAKLVFQCSKFHYVPTCVARLLVFMIPWEAKVLEQFRIMRFNVWVSQFQYFHVLLHINFNSKCDIMFLLQVGGIMHMNVSQIITVIYFSFIEIFFDYVIFFYNLNYGIRASSTLSSQLAPSIFKGYVH